MSRRAMNFFHTAEWKEKCWFQRFFRKDQMYSSVPTWHYSGLYPPPFRLPNIKMCAKTNKEYIYKCRKAKCSFLSLPELLEEECLLSTSVYIFYCQEYVSVLRSKTVSEFIQNSYRKGHGPFVSTKITNT